LTREGKGMFEQTSMYGFIREKYNKRKEISFPFAKN